MADEEKTYETRIEGNTAIWEMREEGPIEGTYAGTFRFRCFLTPMQKISANREMREILGINPTLAPEHESFLAYALTQLRQRIIDSPPFWKTKDSMSGDLADENIITEVLNAAISAELKYKEQLKEKKDSALKRAVKAAEALMNQRDSEDKDEKEE